MFGCGNFRDTGRGHEAFAGAGVNGLGLEAVLDREAVGDGTGDKFGGYRRKLSG